MKRDRTQQSITHKKADRIEPKVARSVLSSVMRMRERIHVDGLTIAIANGDVRSAMTVLSEAGALEALHPLSAILKETVLDGGKLVEPVVNGGR